MNFECLVYLWATGHWERVFNVSYLSHGFLKQQLDHHQLHRLHSLWWLLSGTQWVALLQSLLCVGLVPQNVLTPNGSNTKEIWMSNSQRDVLWWRLGTQKLFTFRRKRHESQFRRLHVFKVVDPSLCVSFPHFSQCLVLVRSRPQNLPGRSFSFHVSGQTPLFFYKR